MTQTVVRSENRMERKIINISVKRQLTIPQKYYEALGFDNEAECILKDGCIMLRPVRTENSDFSEEILTELIAQGFTGSELLVKFKERNKKIHPAILKMITEADEMAIKGDGKISLDELFGAEDE